MKTNLVTFVIAIFLLTAKANASACFAWPAQQTATAAMVTQYLDCLAAQPQLTKLSAQWIVLKKSLWQLADGNSSGYTYRYANNLMSPYERNILYVSFNRYNGGNFSQLLSYLESEVFPEALKGFTNRSEDNKTSWSFEAIAYQNVAFNEDPVRPEWNFHEGLNENGASHYYAGTLLESERFRTRDWFDRHASLHPALQIRILNHETNWPQLRNLIRRLGVCDGDADCLVRQEKTVAQGLFTTLEHPQLIEAVHFQRHQGFGINSKNLGRAQEILPQSFGCAIRSDTAIPAEVVITGYMFHDYSLKHLVPYGKWGLMGRALYLEAINKENINPMAGQFQGQNALVRGITDQAVYDFASLGGLGDKNPKIKRIEVQKTFNGGQTYNLLWQLAPGESLQDIVQTRLGGVAQIIANYQVDSRSTSIIQSNPFFTQTILSFGWNLRTWVEATRRWNKDVQYYAYAYDYGLRSAPSNIGWKSYYDRVVWVTQNMFPKVQGVP